MSFGYRILGFGAGGGRPEFMEATGGTVTTSGNDKIHTFNSSGTFTVTTGTDPTDGDKVRYLSCWCRRWKRMPLMELAVELAE